MAFVTTNRDGERIVLLNPAEKGDKFVKELKTGFKRTNLGAFKLDKNKKGIRLNDKERAYRSGYLDARKDSAKCYKANLKKKKR